MHYATTTVLIRLLWTLGIAITGISAVVITTMDASSSSQGQRYYTAIAAIVALGLIDRQIGRLVRRRLPWSFTLHPEERRHHLLRFLLLIVTSLFLIGLAHYRTVGASSGLVWLAAYALALGVGPFVIMFLLNRFARKPLERGIDLLFDAGSNTRKAPRPWTFSFSLGTPPGPSHFETASAPTPVTVAAERAREYVEAWKQIRMDQREDPAGAVKRAHALILDLCAETGSLAPFSRQERFTASALTDIELLRDGPLRKVHDARRVQLAIQAVLAGRSAEPQDLALALAEYERLLSELLDGERPHSGDHEL